MSETSRDPNEGAKIQSLARDLHRAVGEYRGWGNANLRATTFAAVGAEAVTHLDNIARHCDALLDALHAASVPVERTAPPGDDLWTDERWVLDQAILDAQDAGRTPNFIAKLREMRDGLSASVPERASDGEPEAVEQRLREIDACLAKAIRAPFASIRAVNRAAILTEHLPWLITQLRTRSGSEDALIGEVLARCNDHGWCSDGTFTASFSNFGDARILSNLVSSRIAAARSESSPVSTAQTTTEAEG